MSTFPNLRSHPEYNLKRKRDHPEDGPPRPPFGPLFLSSVGKDLEKRPLHARPQAHVDTPQVRRTDWVRACGGPMQPLGKLPKELRVGIIGAGSAGVRTAFEAVKAGCNVTLIEARHEVGGRARSVPMGNKNIGEEGAMRFPPSEGDLYDLSAAFGYGYINGFPDPSIAPTLVSYAGKCEFWDDPKKVPTGFETVTSGWKALVDEGFKINCRKFVSPKQMSEWLQSPNQDVRMKVQEAWQDYIDEFKDDTFRRGLEKIFSPAKGTPPGGKTWTTDDFNRFGKLGIGCGGFGAFFKQCFLTIMRFLPNLWDTDQAIFVKLVHGCILGKPEPAGIRELWQSVWEWATKKGLTTFLKTRATRVSKRKGPDHKLLYTVRVEYPNGSTADLEFDELFCNLTNNVATVDLDLGRTGPGQVFVNATCEAIETVHMVLTTKLIVKVPRSPYFDDPNFPRVLLTDGNLPQAYCLDYDDPEYMVVLLVYAWEEYSARLQAEKDPKLLFEFLKKSAAEAVANSKVYNNWADCLNPVGEILLQHWQDDPTARGAFTFALPGQERHCAAMFYDFEKKEGPGPYLIGDSPSFGGGWTEPAQETVFNCFSAMLKRRGELCHPELAPVNLISSSTYRY